MLLRRVFPQRCLGCHVFPLIRFFIFQLTKQTAASSVVFIVRRWVMLMVKQEPSPNALRLFLNVCFGNRHHVMRVCLWPRYTTSQIQSWGGAPSPKWQHAVDPIPSPRQADGNRAALWPDQPWLHPEKEQNRIININWLISPVTMFLQGASFRQYPI